MNKKNIYNFICVLENLFLTFFTLQSIILFLGSIFKISLLDFLVGLITFLVYGFISHYLKTLKWRYL